MIVYGVKRDVGFDSARLTPESYEQLRLALKETTAVRIRVVDDHERPVAGAKIHPDMATGMGTPAYSISLYGMSEFLETTDNAGLAICHIPMDNAGPILHRLMPVQISIEAEGFVRPWVWWMSDEAVRQKSLVRGGNAPVATGVVTVTGNEFTINLKPALVVRGIVVHADGRPAAGASAGALGYGYDKARYVQGTHCEADGSFKLSLSPGLYYVFNAQLGTERSPYQKQVILADRPSGPLTLVLQPGRRLFGTLTSGPEKALVARQHLSIYWRDD